MPVILTAALERRIQAEHAALREVFRWTSDIALTGRVENWGPLQLVGQVYEGDCDSWAWTMQDRLAAAGLPHDALRLAVCWVPPPAPVSGTDMNHCVLAIDTDRGWLVSCCRMGVVWPRSVLPYLNWYRAPAGPITNPWEQF